MSNVGCHKHTRNAWGQEEEFQTAGPWKGIHIYEKTQREGYLTYLMEDSLEGTSKIYNN